MLDLSQEAPVPNAAEDPRVETVGYAPSRSKVAILNAPWEKEPPLARDGNVGEA